MEIGPISVYLEGSIEYLHWMLKFSELLNVLLFILQVATNCRSPTSPIQTTDDEKEDIYVNYPTFSRRPKPRF